jgi:hypothetical protein
MIKSISGGNGVQVDNGYFSFPYINNNNSNNPMLGMLRIHGNDLQVFDGHNWILLGGGYPTISLNGVAQSSIDWVQKKIAEEAKAKELAAKHPAVAEALNAINEAHDKLKVIVALTEEDAK